MISRSFSTSKLFLTSTGFLWGITDEICLGIMLLTVPVHAGDPLHVPQASAGEVVGGHVAAEVAVLGGQFAGGQAGGACVWELENTYGGGVCAPNCPSPGGSGHASFHV